MLIQIFDAIDHFQIGDAYENADAPKSISSGEAYSPNGG
jgi:hypothetical protein